LPLQESICTRCSPGKFKRAMEKLDNSKTLLVQKLGFGPLLNIGCGSLDLELCLKLVHTLECTESVLSFRGLAVRITPEDVGAILGIPFGGKLIKPTVPDHDRLNKFKKEELHATKWTDLERILHGNSSGSQFQRAFLLYALGILLCLGNSLMPNILN